MADYSNEVQTYNIDIVDGDSVSVEEVFYGSVSVIGPVLQSESPTGTGVDPFATVSFTLQVDLE